MGFRSELLGGHSSREIDRSFTLQLKAVAINFYWHMTTNLISADSAETLFRRGGNISQLLIAQSLNNACAKILKSDNDYSSYD